MHAASPAIKEVAKPIARTEKEVELSIKFPSNRSFAIFPNINGTTIKNENLAALVLSFPNNTEVEIVAPLLEIPGKIAIA